MKIINVRGCNGSGKTTLLRCLARHPDCVVVVYQVPARGNEIPPELLKIPVTFTPDGLAIVGDYTPAAAGSTTAGCDRIKTQDAAKAIVKLLTECMPPVRAVLFEGIVVSTIYGPWRDFNLHKLGGRMIWAFLDTPLDVCLKRIQERNGGKPIKEDQVADKHRTIARVREKALKDGERVADIRWETALKDFKELLK